MPKLEAIFKPSLGALNYPAFSETVSVPSELIEGGGGPIDLTLSYDAGTTTPGDGTITATIAAASTLNVKQLDLYGGGLSATTPGYPLAAFSLSTNSSGGAGNVGVRIMTGIPDREFGDGAHDFLYLPVVAEDGNTWLNNNLGADYSNVNHASFDPTQQATAFDDHLAYGSLYQWGRFSDGHEFFQNRKKNINRTMKFNCYGPCSRIVRSFFSHSRALRLTVFLVI